MAIMRWDPFGEMLSMQREMDRIFSRMGARGGDGERTAAWMPKIDVLTRGGDLVVKAELPGMRAEDIDISVTENMLSIKGERKEEKKAEDEGYVVRESSYGAFQRTLTLPEGVDASQIKADYREGVLEVTVPKAAEITQPKTHKVEIGQGS